MKKLRQGVEARCRSSISFVFGAIDKDIWGNVASIAMKKLVWILLAASPAWAQTGAELFEKNCTGCHKAGSPTHAPAPEALRQM